MKKFLLFLMFALFCIPWAANAQTLFSEGFEGGSMPTGWTTDGPGTWSVGSGDYSTSTGAGLGTYNALITHSSTGNVTKLITPEIDLSSVPSATLSFMHVQRSWAGDVDELRVYYRTSSSETWTQLVEYTGAVASWTTEEDIVLPNTSATYQLAFEHTDKYGYGVGLDQVVISAPSSCPKPTLGAAEYVSTEGVSFQWTENGTATQWELQYSTSADFTNPTTINRNGIPAYAITGLNAATGYYVRVRSNCGDGEFSDWSNVVSFSTLCDAFNLPYAYGFEDANELNCWNVIYTANTPGIYNGSAYEGNNSFRFSSYSSASSYDQYLISPELNTTNGVDVTFYYMNSSSYGEETFKVGYSTTTNDPTAFTWGDEIVANELQWTLYEGSFPAGTKYVGVYYYSNYQYYLYVDDFTFEVPSSCRKPTNLAASEIGPRTAKLSWTENGEATAWNLMVNGELIENVTNPYTLTGLTPETAYTVQVSPVCEVEKWSDAITFRTEVACPAPTALEVVPTPFSATVTWTGDASNYILRYGTCAEPDPTQPATIIFHADDIWQDGSGYQMLLDADATAYGTIIPETGALSTECSGNETIYAEFEYKLPANADGECSTSNVVIDNTITLQIPAGTYDWCITNPTPGDRIWIASAQGNVGGRADDYVFEGGMTYEFNMYMLGSNDATDVTVRCSNVDWTTVNNATSPYTINGLDPETEYYVGVQTVCGGEDGESVWTNTSFTTPSNCEAPSALNVTNLMSTTATLNWTGYQDNYEVHYRPLTSGDVLVETDFEDSDMGEWTTIDADGDGYGWILGSACDGVYLDGGNLAGTGHNSSADLVTSGSYSNVVGALTPDNYFVSPQVALGGTISFYATAQDASYNEEHFGVAVSTMGNTDPADFITIQDWTYTPNKQDVWVKYTVDLSAYVGQTGYVAIRHFNCTDQFLLDVDDIVITAPVEEEVDWLTVTTAEGAFNLTGLDANTAYEWQVRGVNSSCDGGYTEWSEAATFTTGEVPSCVDVFVEPESFETYTTSTERWAGDLPECWTIAHHYTTVDPDTVAMIYYKPAFASDGSYSLRMHHRGIVAMPALPDDVDFSRLQLNMNVRQSQLYYTLQVGVMTDLEDESSFVPVALCDNETTDEVPESFKCNFANYTVPEDYSGPFYIAFKNTGKSNNDSHSVNYLDEVTLSYVDEAEVPTCAITALDYPEDFEELLIAEDGRLVPACWTLPEQYETSIATKNKPQLYKNFATSGNYSLKMRDLCVYAMPEYAVEGTPIQEVTMTFNLRQPNRNYRLEVGVMTDANDPNTFELVQLVNNTSTDMVNGIEVSFADYVTPANAEHLYIAFRNTAKTASWTYSYNYIDDILLTTSDGGNKIVETEEGDEFDAERYLDNIAVYPNPTTGMLHIDAMDVQKVECYSQMGQLVGVYDNVNELNIGELAKGVYMLRITVPQGVTMRKVVKR